MGFLRSKGGKMEYLTEYLWEKNGRETNEDSLSINQVMINNQPLLMGVVCDGIGSLENGEFASSYVVSSLKTQFENAGKTADISLRKIGHELCRELYICHEELKSKNTGTTVCVVVIYKNRAMFLCIGDSRIYLGRKRMRIASRDDADNMGRLTAAIGVGSYKKVRWRYRRIWRDMKILLCSDGFYKRNHMFICSHGCFESKYTENDMQNKLKEINAQGLKKGERDNASAVIIWRR